jgi:hypothetical protein
MDEYIQSPGHNVSLPPIGYENTGTAEDGLGIDEVSLD